MIIYVCIAFPTILSTMGSEYKILLFTSGIFCLEIGCDITD